MLQDWLEAIFSLEILRLRGEPHLHSKPGVEEERVIVVGTNRGTVELVIVGVLQADAGIRPGPADRLAGPERDVSDLAVQPLLFGVRALPVLMSTPYRLASELPQISKYCPVNTIRLSLP